MSSSEDPEEKSHKSRVWDDPDESSELKNLEEPEWLKKRRIVLKEAKDDDLDKNLKFSGKFGRIKPSKFKTGVRFKVTRQQGTKEPIKIKGGVKQLQFDSDDKYLSVLGFRERGLKLYFVDQNRTKFNLKNTKKDLVFDDFITTGSTLKDDSLLLIGRNKKLLKYDISRENAMGIFSFVVPRTETAFKDICSSNHYNYYAISCVNTGTLLVCNFKDNLLVHNFKMNSECVGLGFSETTLVSCDRDSNIYEFDLKAGKCRRKFKDSHSLHVSSFSVYDSSENSFFAIGTKSGYVNLYNLGSNTPFKIFDNLTTEITSLYLGENFTLFSSIHKKNAVRVAYNRNYNVIANWPNDKSNLGRASSLSYCSQSKIIAIGTRSGRVHFYRFERIISNLQPAAICFEESKSSKNVFKNPKSP